MNPLNWDLGVLPARGSPEDPRLTSVLGV